MRAEALVGAALILISLLLIFLRSWISHVFHKSLTRMYGVPSLMMRCLAEHRLRG